MENKLTYWKWLQKDNTAAIIMLSVIIGIILYVTPNGSYPILGYIVAGVFTIGLLAVIIKSCILDWIKYRRSDD